METSMTRVIASTFAVFALVTTVSSANAAEYGRTTRQMVVSYDDLNLSRPAGAQILLERLRMASSSVCGGRPDVRYLDAQKYYRDCFGEAMKGAIAQVDSPLVAELYGEPALKTAAAPAAEKVASRGDDLDQHPSLFQRLADAL
jgi:UrcA family protein